MNKIYRVVWSKVKNCYVVTSELAKNHTKSPVSQKISKSLVAGVLLSVLSSGMVMPVYADSVKGLGINGVGEQSMNYEGGGALGYDTVAIGDAKSAGSASVSIGTGSLVTGQNSIAIGTNAMASGDNATRELVDQLLTNNKAIRDGLDTARSEFTASQNDYNLQLERFNKQNEAYARVQYANELIAGYQNEIDTTLQPAADTANAAYNTAKADYDDLSNRLAQQLDVVRYIDFTQYQQPGSDVIDTNAVAADIKAQAEAGTDFNYPQEMYKAYVDSYIESEGNGRYFFSIANLLGPTTSYSNNNTIKNVSFTVKTTTDNFLVQGGFMTEDKISNGDVFSNLVRIGNNLSFNADTGDNYTNLPWWQLQSTDLGMAYAGNIVSYDYAKTATLDDNSFNSKVDSLNTLIDNKIDTVTNRLSKMRNSGVLTASEIENLDYTLTSIVNFENERRNILLNILNYAHEGYLYDKYKSEDGEESVSALEHLSNQGEYKRAIFEKLGTTEAEKLFLKGSSNTVYFNNMNIIGWNTGDVVNVTGYNRMASNSDGQYFKFLSTLSTRIADWYMNNIIAHEDNVRFTLNKLQGSMNDFLADKRTAYEEATAAKTAADNALNAKRQQIAQATPTQEDIDAANAAQASATELQQKADKLEADRVALENAKAALDQLQSIEESGSGAIAVGNNAITTGENAVGIGSDVIVTGEKAVGVGKDNIVSGKESVGVGSSNSISSEKSIAIGTNNGVTGEQSIVVGTGNVVAGSHSGAIGDPNIVNADYSYAVGNNSYIDESSSDMFVLGNNVKATGTNSVVLGSQSDGSQDNVVSVGHKATDLNVAGIAYGSDLKRRITNVADGIEDSDVVTLGQMNTALQTVDTGVDFTTGSGLQMDNNSVLSVKGSTNVTVNNNGVSVIGNGSVSSGNTGLISGDTLYNEVRIPNNGNYIKANSTIADNLYRLDNAVSNAGVKYFGVNSPSQTSMNYEGGGAMGYDSIAIGDAKSAGSASIGIGAGSLVTGQNSIAIGTNAMASGDGMSREAVDSILSNNRNIREGLDTARSAYTASQNAYNLQLEKFNGQNEAVARVNAANALITGYQNEINSTLQPNADTANDAYNTAKADYDDLSNRLAQQLEVVKYIDFTQYQQPGSDTIDTNAVAADIKAQAEAGTDFNYPQEMYKAYVDSYIESEGNGRQTFTTASNLHPSSSYSNNNTIQTIVLDTSGKALDNFLSQVGWKDPSLTSNVFTNVRVKSSFVTNVNTGAINSSSTGSVHDNDGRQANFNLRVNNYPSFFANGYLGFGKTTLINDTDYSNYISQINTFSDNQVARLQNTIIPIRDSGVFDDADKTSLNNMLDYYITYEEFRRSFALNLINYSHEQYLYEKYKAEEGETSNNALLHLSKKGEYKEAVAALIGDSQAEKLFTPGDSTRVVIYGNRINDEYNAGYGIWRAADYDWAIHLQQRINDWYKGNVTDHQNLVKYTLYQLQGSMNDFLADKRTAYEEATAAKTAADNALNAKRQQIAQATPSQADIDAANAAEATATELQQKADKLEADRTALETAKAALDELQSIEEAGKGAIAIGDTAITTGEDAVGMGTNVIVTGENAVAIGKGSIISGDRAVALGINNSISKEQSIAIGTNNGITGENSIAIGNNNVISGNNSIAIGNSLNVTDDNVVSIGNRRMTNIATGTADTDAVNVKQLNDALSDFDAYTAGTAELLTAGTDTTNQVWSPKILSGYVVGQVSAEQTARQEADALLDSRIGTLSANGNYIKKSDTNNVSANLFALDNQLKATNDNIAGFAADINRNKTNIASLNTSVTAALGSVSSASSLVTTLNDTKADASLNNLTVAGRNVIAVAAANAVQEYMASQNSTNTANPVAPTAYNQNSLTVTNAGNGSLYVGEGSNVNGSQSIAIGVGNQVNANNAGAFGDPSIINADESYVLGNDDTVNTGAVASFIVGNDSVSSAKGGLLFGSNSEATDTAENSIGLGNHTTVSAKNAVALGSGSIANEENTVSVGNDELKRRITNIADGNIAENSTDAVTGGQLYTTNQTVLNHSDLIAQNASNILDNAKEIANNKLEIATKADFDAGNIDTEAWSQKLGTGKVEDGNTGLVTGGTVYDSMKALAESNPVQATDEAIFIGPTRGGNVVSVYNKDGESRVITGVATNPEDVTSAANVGYVNTVASNVMENINGRFAQTDKRMNKVGASAAALASLTPATFEGDEKWSLAASVGKFHGETAGAIGAFYKPTENVMLNVRGTVGSDENMLGAGVAVSLSKGDVPGVTKRQLAVKVNRLEQTHEQDRIQHEQDRNQIAQLNQRIAQLENMVQNMAKHMNTEK